MKVMVVAAYDSQPGELNAIIEITPDKTENEVFLDWLRTHVRNSSLTWQEAEDLDFYNYGCNTYEVQRM
jgi:hypothetical protein